MLRVLFVPLLMFLALVPGESVASVELRYQAFIAGAPAGRADVEVDVNETTYVVRGTARSEGLWDTFSKWRSSFRVMGWLSKRDVNPATDHELPLNKGAQEYYYYERGSDKKREVMVRDGQLQVTKNGRVRPAVAALPGMDILTALFVHPHCSANMTLHTGRHGYQLNRTGDRTDRCEYRVIDDDGDSHAASITMGQVGELTVPTRIDFTGALGSSLVLVGH